MLNDYVYGSSGFNGEIFVNTPLIWRDSKDEDRFIKNFSKVLLHELLHVEIYKVYESLHLEKIEEFFNDKEESIVRSLCKTKTRYLK